MMAVVVENVSKAYQGQMALQNVSLTIPPGVTALLGSNGSGKSTLLRLLATLIQPDSGLMRLNQWVYPQHTRDIRRCLGYAPQELELPEQFTPRQLLDYLGKLRAPLRVGKRGGAAADLLTALAMNDFAQLPLGKLSGGQLRLVGIAQAFLGDPHLLLLDEPTRGLDITERERVFHLIRQRGTTHLVLFSTHIPAEAEAVAQQVVILRRGRVLYTGSIEQLKRQAAGHVYEIHVANAEVNRLLTSATVSRVRHSEGAVCLRCIGESPAGYTAVSVPPSVEDGYLYVTSIL